LIVLAYIGLVGYTFVTNFSDIDNAELQFALAIPLIIVVPAFFLARHGWRLSHQSPIMAAYQIKNNSEKIVAVIETSEEKALYFTSERVVVAYVAGLGDNGYSGSTDLFGLIFTIMGIVSARSSINTVKQLGMLPPEIILSRDLRNFAIPYSDVVNISIFKKLLSHRMKIVTSKDMHNYRSKPSPDGYAIEFKLNKPRQWNDNLTILRTTLPDKIRV